MTGYPRDAIAIVGAAVNFPGAPDLDAFAALLRDGREAMLDVPSDVLAASPHAAVAGRSGYVPTTCMLGGHDLFDAGFFGLTPREALILDPQQRHLLQCAWQAFEHAGIVPGDNDDRRTGVFTSISHSAYMTHYLLPQVLSGQLDIVEVGLSNDKDFAPARLAWRMDLRGPAIAVQTACSSSLVAVHLACRSLSEGECDLAVVAASTIIVPAGLGYLRPERGMVSADGRCRPFTAQADGTIFASGAGAVLLRPLVAATAAGDAVMAVIRGSAVNNDGARRAGFTAPNPDGQSAVIAEALAVAEVEGGQIDYIEAHGTATPLGDPIEVTALTEALRDAGASPAQGIAIGAVKANIGHLDTAAGLAGLLKTALALGDERLPPTPHAEPDGPTFDGTPLRPVVEAMPWPRGPRARIAGVSAFGMGGSNAHVVVQEAPAPAAPAPARDGEVLVVSARNPDDLTRRLDALADRLDDPSARLADIAHSLRVGRRAFPARAILTASSAGEAARALRAGQVARSVVTGKPPLVFVLPGQGSQYAALGASLALAEPAFAAHRARLIAALGDHGGPDLDDAGTTDAAMRDTWLAQATLFVNGAAIGLTLLDWGFAPDAIVGHSVGEVAAALLSGALDEDAAARLIVARAAAMRDAPPGAMALLQTNAAAAGPLIGAAAQGEVLTLAAFNAPGQVVASGETPAVARLVEAAAAAGIGATRLATSHAFHSALMAEAARQVDAVAAALRFSRPQRQVISTLTGAVMEGGEAGFGAPGYWGRQMLSPVRFSDAIASAGEALFVELGPPGGLSAAVPAGRALSLLPHRDHRNQGGRRLLDAVGLLWLAGHEADWKAFDAAWPGRQRVRLPGYPFRPDRHWPDEPGSAVVAQPTAANPTAGQPIAAATAPALAVGPTTLPRQPRPADLPDAVAPAGEVETRLAGLYEELLLIAPIGRNDSFAALGGSSISALQLAQRAAEQGLRLTVAEVFDSRDIADLAARAARQQVAAAEAAPPRPAAGPAADAPPDTPPDAETMNIIRAQLTGI